MKPLFLFCALFVSVAAFSQDETTDKNSLPTAVTNFNTYGYIDGKRLDSIESVYATFAYRSDRGVTFDYGNIKARNRDYLLTDNKGMPLQFMSNSSPFLLNFFHYNHWEFFNNVSNSYTGSITSTLILKKQ